MVEFDSNDSSKNELKQSKHTQDRVNKSLDYVDQEIVETSHLLSTKSRQTRGTEIKMSKVHVISIDQTMKLVPVFDEENPDSNHAFLNACKFASQNIDPSLNDIFIKFITTRLIGKAYRAIRYEEVKSFSNLKVILNSLIDNKHALD